MAEDKAPGGLSGALRLAGALAVIIVALIGILVVLDVIPRAVLEEWAVKGGLILAIVIAAAVALSLIGRAGGGRS